jgi:regulator of protease activity HflC (stomatin/prohibitin superfamily)
VREPGLRFLIPFIDRPVIVDVRETFNEIPSQTAITKDNAPIDIDFLIYWKIVDALSSVVNVNNFQGALQGIATTTLRAVIGDMNLDDVLSKRSRSTRSCARSSTRSPSAGAARSRRSRSARSCRRATSRTP